MHASHWRVRRTLSTVLVAALAAAGMAFAPAPAPAPSPASEFAPPAPSLAARVVDGELRTTVNGMYDRTGLAPDEDVHDAMTWIRAARRLAEAGGMRTMAPTDACLPLDGSRPDGSRNADPDGSRNADPDGSRNADPDGSRNADCEEELGEEEPGEDEEWSFGYLEALGDLDGDGWEDVLEVAASFAEGVHTESLTARSGRDGAELWSTEGPAFDGFGFTAAAPDLDGDGGDDLLLVEWVENWTWGESCTPVRCTYSDEFGEGIRLTAVDGDTGAMLGSATHQFRVVFSGEHTAVGTEDLWAAQYQGSLELVGALTWLAFADPEGDGAHRLLRGAVDLQEEWTGVDAGVVGGDNWDIAHAGHATWSVTSDVDLIDFVDGSSTTILADEPSLVFTASAELGGADAIILDAYEMGAEEVFGCVHSDTLAVHDCGSTSGVGQRPVTGGTRTLLGADLQPVWEAPITFDVLAVYGAAGDVTGDGADDLLEAEVDWETFTVATNVIDGATGATVWSAPVDGGIAADGDLLAVSFTWTSDEGDQGDGSDGSDEGDDAPEVWAYQVSAEAFVLDGADGSLLTSRELASVEGRDDGSGTVVVGWLAVGLLPLAGAGADVLTLAEQVTLEEVGRHEECWEYEDPETGEVMGECWEWVEYELVELLAELCGHSGDDLAKLFHLDLGWDWFLDVVDLDGDGLAEVLLESFDGESGAFETAARRQDGSTLWVLVDEFVTGILGTPDGPSLVGADLWTGDSIVREGDTLVERWRIAGGGGGGGGGVVIVL